MLPIESAAASPAPRPTTRFDTIDLLRGLSILAVILLHIYIRFFLNGFDITRPISRTWVHTLFFNGGNGVTVFFAISGFLINYTSLQRFGALATMRPGTFYRIRFARIAPLLLLLLAVLVALDLLHIQGYTIDKPHASLPGALFSALTFTLNWYEAAHMKSYLPACWTVLWSLSIEEMFYLFFPLVCLLFFRTRRGLIPFIALLLALIVTGCFARTVWDRGDGLAQENSYLAGMANIAVGVLAALLTHHLATRPPLSRRTLITLQTLGATLILLFAFYPHWHWIRPFMRFTGRSGTDDLLLTLGTALVMMATVLRRRPGLLVLAPLRWLGRHSYELYLSHEFVVLAVTNRYLKLQVTHNPGPLLAWAAATVALTIPVAWLVTRFISEPLNHRLRPGAYSNNEMSLAKTSC